MQLLRTSNQDEQFVALTRQLDDELRQRYGELQDLYTPHNRLDCIDTALLGVVEGQAVACGCFKWLDGQRAEVKRMFVHPQWRRRGYSEQLLRALESWERNNCCWKPAAGSPKPSPCIRSWASRRSTAMAPMSRWEIVSAWPNPWPSDQVVLRMTRQGLPTATL